MTAIGFLWNVIYIKTMTQLTSTIHYTDTHALFVQSHIFTLFHACFQLLAVNPC